MAKLFDQDWEKSFGKPAQNQLGDSLVFLSLAF